MGYSPWGCKESAMTQLSLLTFRYLKLFLYLLPSASGQQSRIIIKEGTSLTHMLFFYKIGVQAAYNRRSSSSTSTNVLL